MNDCIAIMMAVYNGQDYLEQQIISIIQQTYTNWRLFIRDDGSSDASLDIVKRIVNIDDRITLINESELVGGGSKENFAAIREYVKANYNFSYFMFSDQDDVWCPQKVEKTLCACKDAEAECDGPVLVHADLEVVDAELNTLGPSFVAYRALDVNRKDLNHLLVQNNVTGCTMLWNRKLDNLVEMNDSRVAMHDWWMALVASLFGEIRFVDEPLVKYRQHGKNVVGATNVNSIGFVAKRLVGLNHVRGTFDIAFKQARLLEDCYKEKMTEKQRNAIRLFYSIQEKNKISRVRTLVKCGFLKQGPVQVIGELLFI